MEAAKPLNQELGDRTSYLGASDLPAVCGLSPYTNPLGLWLEKTGQAEPFEGNLATRMGLHMEPLLAALYEEKTGRRVRMAKELIHPDHDFIRAHLDRVTVDFDRDVELKTADPLLMDQWGPEGTDIVPDHYFGQAQVQMHLAGLPVADIAVAFGSRTFRVYTVGYDQRVAEHLIGAGVRFWLDHVLPRRAPPIDGSDIASAWLERRFSNAADQRVVATPELDELALQLRAARAAKKKAEEAEALAKNRIKEAIGDAKTLEGAWGRIIWTKTKKGNRPLITKFHGEEQ